VVIVRTLIIKLKSELETQISFHMESRESMHIKNQISGTSKRNNTLDGATAGNSSAI